MSTWSPWPTKDRPTADSVTSDELDELLVRLEQTEDFFTCLTERFFPMPDKKYEDLRTEMFHAFRKVAHRRYCPSRPIKGCRRCLIRTTHLLYTWETLQQGGKDAVVEKRLEHIQRNVTRSPMMAWSDADAARESRRDVPWLLAQVRLLQRTVRRLEASIRRDDKAEDRQDQRSRDLATENGRLRARVAELEKGVRNG